MWILCPSVCPSPTHYHQLDRLSDFHEIQYRYSLPKGEMWVCGLDWAGAGQGQVADACECGNEPSGSIKCGEFLD